MARTDVVNIGTNARDVRKSTALMPYSRVIVVVDEETEYEAGNTSGLTLEVECPWGSQAMANNLLATVRGYQYQPYTVTGAIVDMAAEMGDAISANSVYGGIYQQDIDFGFTCYSDCSAPEDEQLDHEYKYESPTERRITRQSKWTRAEFRITNDAIEQEVAARQSDGNEFRATLSTHADEIAARVTQLGGNNSSFGWSLISTAFKLYSGNKAVFTCDKNGISVDGSITARSGYIGNGSNGFTIGNTYIKNGKDSATDSKTGVYIGTNGIGVGNGIFSVDTSGNLSAKGKITATSGYIGNGAYGFEIGNTYIRNGKDSPTDSKTGVYIGTNGIGVGNGIFSVDTSGNLSAKGKITATSGYIGNGSSGFTIGNTYIKNGKDSPTDSNTGVYIGTNGIGVGNGIFSVDTSGNLSVKGKVTATSGYIGNGSNGFEIGSTYIRNGMTSLSDTTNNGIFVGTNGIALGKGNFKVSSSGSLVAKEGTIGSGSNPWNIGNSSIYRGKTTFSSTSAGIYIGDSGLAIGAGKKKTVYYYATSNDFPRSENQLDRTGIYHANDTGDDWYWDGNWHNLGPSGTSAELWLYTAPFKVDSSGNITAHSGTFNGTVYASRLTFSNPDGSTYTIDGSNITEASIADGKISGLDGAKLTESSVSDAKISGVGGSKLSGSSVARSKVTQSFDRDISKGTSARDDLDDLLVGRLRATYINAMDLQANTAKMANLNFSSGGSTYYAARWITGKTFVTGVDFTNKTVTTDSVATRILANN